MYVRFISGLVGLAAASAAAAATPPSAPIGAGVAPGNGMAVVSFQVPVSNGGAPISGYTATCSTGAAGPPAIGGHGIGLDFLGTSSTAVATAAFNTVAGSIVLASVGRGGLADFASATVSDNKGNGNYVQQGTAHPYTLYASSGTALYAKLNAAGGNGHTVSTTKPGATDEVTVIAAEFRNVDTIVDARWVEDRTSPNTSASVTTTGPAILAAFWWGDNAFGELNPAVDAGWTVLDHTSSLASNHVQSASAYRVVNAAGTYAINWTPSTAQGAQLWIVAMQSLAGGTTVSASGLSSPIIVKGLANGTTTQCVVTAANSAGTGAASAAAAVTPSAAAPFALVAVQSRKTHGAAGIFDLGIATQPVNGQVTVEPRQSGPGHSLVFQFNGPVSAAGSATLSPSGSATTTGTGNEVLVNLNGVVDNQRTTVTLSGVNIGFNPAPVTLGFLLGDVNNSRSVLASDISVVKARAGQTTNGANFRFDLDLSGTVDAVDTSKAKTGSGLVLP